VDLQRWIGRREFSEAAGVRIDEVGSHAVIAAEDRDQVTVGRPVGEFGEIGEQGA
jgi:hypothetical protein